jgi:hypothetical protein
LKNVGTCAWSTSYQLVFSSGQQMGAPASAAFPQNVAVGQTVDVSVNMTAPSTAGSYRGYWMFKNASGALFGIGTQANKPWWVDIRVSGPTATPGGTAGSAYDFVAHMCDATWYSGAGKLPCPGTETDNNGFVLKVTSPKLETGATDTRPALLTFPQALNNGYIQGFYPPFRVQNGDRFRSTINCDFGATICYVGFRLDYQTGTGSIRTFWGPFLERYEGRFYNVDVNLSSLAGQDVKFILTVLAEGNAQQDRALWVGPYIYRAGATTPPASATTYQNQKYNFKFTVPAGGSIVSQSDTFGRVNLPLVATGTTLQEKYIEVSVAENKDPCVTTTMENGGDKTTVTINNIPFTKQSGQGAAAGNRYDWTAYSTVTSSKACIILAFVLHSTNPGNYTTPPPDYDKAKESAVIDAVMNTYSLITGSYP